MSKKTEKKLTPQQTIASLKKELAELRNDYDKSIRLSAETSVKLVKALKESQNFYEELAQDYLSLSRGIENLTMESRRIVKRYEIGAEATITSGIPK